MRPVAWTCAVCGRESAEVSMLKLGRCRCGAMHWERWEGSRKGLGLVAIWKQQ